MHLIMQRSSSGGPRTSSAECTVTSSRRQAWFAVKSGKSHSGGNLSAGTMEAATFRLRGHSAQGAVCFSLYWIDLRCVSNNFTCALKRLRFVQLCIKMTINRPKTQKRRLVFLQAYQLRGSQTGPNWCKINPFVDKADLKYKAKTLA